MFYSSDFTKDFYSMKEVANFLDFTPKYIQILCNKGKLDCVKSESGWRKVPKDALLRYLEEHGLLVRDKEQCDDYLDLIRSSDSLSYILDKLLTDKSYFSYIDMVEKAIRYDEVTKND